MTGRVPQSSLGVSRYVSAWIGRRLGKPSRFSLRDDAGQTLTEYALVILLVVVLAIGAMTSIGNSVNFFLESVAGQV